LAAASLTSAHKTDDLQAGTVLQGGGPPACARRGVAIQFDGNAAVSHAQSLDRQVRAEGRAAALFSIDHQKHNKKIADCRFPPRVPIAVPWSLRA
jgi:hypothetical protein